MYIYIYIYVRIYKGYTGRAYTYIEYTCIHIKRRDI